MSRAPLHFLLLNLRAGVYGLVLLTLVLATAAWYPPGAAIARYDLLLVAALAVQGLLLAFRRETWREAVVILVFHACGTTMELFKTRIGSWSYPETCILAIGSVPLFAGFMYAAVGSYIARANRLFDIRYSVYPRMRWTLLLAVLIYENFFTQHFIPDLRLGLFALTVVLFGRAAVQFRVGGRRHSMPLLLAFAAVALGIWLAENVATFGRIWIYPSQASGFVPVAPAKLGSWFLLMIVSFVLVSLVHRPRLAEAASGRLAGRGRRADGAADDVGLGQAAVGAGHLGEAGGDVAGKGRDLADTEVDVQGDQLAGGRYPALTGVTELLEDMQPLGVVPEKLQAHPYRISLGEFALVDHMHLAGEHRQVAGVHVALPDADQLIGFAEGGVEKHVIVGHVQVAVIVDPLGADRHDGGDEGREVDGGKTGRIQHAAQPPPFLAVGPAALALANHRLA